MALTTPIQVPSLARVPSNAFAPSGSPKMSIGPMPKMPESPTASLENRIIDELSSFVTVLQSSPTKGMVEKIDAAYQKYMETAQALPGRQRILQKAEEVGQLLNKAKSVCKRDERIKRMAFEDAMQRAEARNTAASVLEIVNGSKHASGLIAAAGKVQHADKQSPTIQLEFGTMTRKGTRATVSAQGLIRVNEDLPFREKVSAVLFEMTNVIQRPKFDAIAQKVLKGEITDANTYVKAIENVEYEGTKLFSEMMQKCIQEEGWDPKMDIYGESLKNEWSTFEGYYNHQRISKHSTSYFQHFRQLQQLAEQSKPTAANIPAKT